MNRLRDFVIINVFFLSGFSALLYQVIWQRMLGLFAGADIRSVTIITGAYLAGLGMGSLIASLNADKLTSRRAVIVFGICNLGIAIFALVSRSIYYDLLFKELSFLAENPIVLSVVAFISLLFPTTLMGLSLPLLSKALVRNMEGVVENISVLYGVNTVGAGVGALLAGWQLAGSFGFENSLYLGAGLSALVGGVALLTSRLFALDDATAVIASAERLSLHNVPRSVWVWCVLVFASGFIFISLEILWFRILNVAMEGTAYTFAHLLGFVLIFDALGSVLGTRFVQGMKAPREVFLWLQGIIAFYALSSLWLLVIYAPDFTWFGRVGQVNNSAVQQFYFMYLLLPFLIVGIPSFMVGLYFPIVQKAIQDDLQTVGQRVGLVEVANIIGNTAGSILTGALLLSWLGTTGTLRLISLLGLGFILLLMVERWIEWRRSVWKIGIAIALITVLGVTAIRFPDQADFWRVLHQVEATHPFYIAEDGTGISAVDEYPDYAEIFINGEGQGQIPFLTVHTILGIVPALTHPNPENIFIIGIGSTATPYSAGVNPATKRIVAIEIVDSVVNVLRDYSHIEGYGSRLNAFFTDPRLQIIVGDGRHELTLTEDRYDIIQADAIYPWRAGAGLLYSREFFEIVKSRLDDDGIMFQWVPTERIRRTFRSVFPYGVDMGMYMIGSLEPIVYDPQTILTHLDDPQIIQYLEEATIQLEEIRGSIPTQWVEWGIEDALPIGDINTDLFPRDEYYLNNS
ncbi:MAG: spermidine synthase [Phototrophicaceae bacterium]